MTLELWVVLSRAWIIHLSRKEEIWVVDSAEQLAEGVMPQLSAEELIEAEEIVRGDERVRKLAADIGEHTLHTPLCPISLMLRPCLKVWHLIRFSRMAGHWDMMIVFPKS